MRHVSKLIATAVVSTTLGITTTPMFAKTPPDAQIQAWQDIQLCHQTQTEIHLRPSDYRDRCRVFTATGDKSGLPDVLTVTMDAQNTPEITAIAEAIQQKMAQAGIKWN